MNQVYRIVFNRSLGVWQCVSELAKAHGKSSGKLAKPLAVAVSLAVANSAMATDYTDGQVHNLVNSNGFSDYSVNNDLVSGNGTVLQSNYFLIGFDSTTSTLNMKNQGAINNGKTILGVENGGIGQIFSDNGKITSQELYVGYESKGLLNATNGSVINVNNIFTIGDSKGASGEMLLASSSLTTPSATIGNEGDGVLALKESSTEFTSNSDIIVGNKGNGTVNLNDGTMTATNQIILGSQTTGNGTINIKGNNQDANPILFANKVIVGDAGTGTLNVSGLYNPDTQTYTHSMNTPSI